MMTPNKDENELCPGEKRYLYTYDYLGRAGRQVVQVWNAATEDWSDSPALGAEDRRARRKHARAFRLDMPQRQTRADEPPVAPDRL